LINYVFVFPVLCRIWWRKICGSWTRVTQGQVQGPQTVQVKSLMNEIKDMKMIFSYLQ